MAVDHEFKVERLELDPHYAWLREHQPVARIRLRDGREAWLVTRWEDARRVLSDPVFSLGLAGGLPFGPPREERTYSLAELDPPEHTRVRRHVFPAFTRRRVQRLRPRVEGIVSALLDRMAEHGPPADLVRQLAFPLPMTVICELLGVPDDDRERFGKWSDALLSVSAYSPEEMVEANTRLRTYLAELIAEHRKAPADDMLSDLIRIRDEQDGLTEAELVTLGTTLLVAGYETTASQLTNLTYTLLDQRRLWDRLVAEPEKVPTAIEELLRTVPLGASTGLPRLATADVELSGVQIRRGDVVVIARNTANRDERVFPHGDTIDFDRPENPHMAFGHGIHYCLGAHLARLELQVAIGGLLSRFPSLRPAVPEGDLRWKQGLAVRGLLEFPVTWESP